jgi:hypothetical protein
LFTCPYHQHQHGTYTTSLNEVTQDGLTILQDSYLLGYIARDLVDLEKVKKTTEDDDFKAIKTEIKRNLIDKENSILVFDEADYLFNPSFQ